jgi:Ca-activated chloride channel homolog
MNQLVESVTGLMLLQPAFLWLALLIPLVLLLRRRTTPASVPFAPSPLVQGAGSSRRSRWLVAEPALHAGGLLLLVLALARPVVREQLPQDTEGIDILLCVDLSSSMAATDLDPKRTRLEVAKAAADSFVRGRGQDRIGLLGFARYPDLLCPLTRDHDALAKLLLRALPVASDGPEDATGIGTAVARAAQILGKSRARSRVVVLLTDGEENVAHAETPTEIGPRRAATLARELGVRVYTIVAGVGSRTSAGEWKKLDPTEVAALAESTGGHFFAAPNAETLAAVYQRIDGLERTPAPDPRVRYEDRFMGIALLGMAMILLARLLGSTVLAVSP